MKYLIITFLIAVTSNKLLAQINGLPQDSVEIYQQKSDSLVKFKIEFDSGNYSHLRKYKSMISEFENFNATTNPNPFFVKETAISDWKLASHNRNIKIQELYVENGELTHFSYARMDVEGKSSNVIDANVVMNFFVLPKHWRVGAVINGKFKMRMFIDQPSAPIRTPSNMAGITFFTNTSPNFNSETIKTWEKQNTFYKIASVTFMHHSNGQDSSSYNPDGTINLQTGNFGVNFLEGAFMVGKKDPNRGTNWFLRFGYQHDYIIDDFSLENQKKQLEGQYGQDRINFELSISKRSKFLKKKLFGKSKIKTETQVKQLKKSRLAFLQKSYSNYWRISLVSSFILETNGVDFDKLNQGLNVELKGYWKIPYTPNFMLMSSFGWLGHDYYNIYFEESTSIFRAGIAASLNIGAKTDAYQ